MGLSPPPTLLPARIGNQIAQALIRLVEPRMAPSRGQTAPRSQGLWDASRSQVPVPASLHESLQAGENRS